MKRFTGWAVLAGLVLAASVAHAQMLAPYRAVSDFQGPDFQGPNFGGPNFGGPNFGGPDFQGPYGRPYGAVPPAPPPVYDYRQYGGGPSLLPPQEVYAILRDNGFSPLGVPTQRGLVYTIAVIDRSGEDGRLLIDARNGRIIRFTPAQGNGYGYGRYGQGYDQGPHTEGPYNQGSYGRGSYGRGPYERGPYDQGLPPERMSGYGTEGTLPPPTVIRATPRPPAPIPQAAGRAVPLPAPKPAIAATSPEPTRQSSPTAVTRAVPPPAAAQASAPPATAPMTQASAAPQGSTTVGEAKPAPAIRPTQEMPKVQDLE